MSKRFATPLLLLALVLLSSSDHWTGALAAFSLPANASADDTRRTQPSYFATPATATATTSNTRRPVYASAGTKTAKLDANDSAVLAEVAELQMLADGVDLTLTSEQWTAFAEVALETQSVRLNYEAQIAKAAPSPKTDAARLEIPMYAEAGDAMRQRFEAQLGEQVGLDAAAEILARLGGKLEGHFAGFGVAEQTIEIRGHPQSVDCEVTRTVKYWNAADGSARLSARRETHLPAWEDPNGTTWEPLLALVSA